MKIVLVHDFLREYGGAERVVESMRFYTQTMGFREAFTIKNAEGKPTLAYLQMTRDTFLELA
jgi:hypothetical protein